jgi:hypothetical protein
MYSKNKFDEGLGTLELISAAEVPASIAASTAALFVVPEAMTALMTAWEAPFSAAATVAALTAESSSVGASVAGTNGCNWG